MFKIVLRDKSTKVTQEEYDAIEILKRNGWLLEYDIFDSNKDIEFEVVVGKEKEVAKSDKL